MIRPIDIQEKEFTRGVRGYKEEEVNEFLDEITIDLERLLDELRATKEENSRLVTELERHRGTEGTVLETLEAAKTLMADISSSAEKRADILLKNAELDAQLMTKEAKDMADRIAEESAAIKARFINFRSKYKQLLESELQRFESLSGEMFPELGV
ncbi:MAG: DivIVA domain-containing protein, partial [Firmicutes bacterium]|nr:DivIVA domain-containing protein [Bacillota bacterium]